MNKDIRPDKTSPAYLKKTKSGGLLVYVVPANIFNQTGLSLPPL